jgi:hypothetical protein
MKKSNTFKKCAIATIVAGSFMAPVHAQNTVSPGFDGFVSGSFGLVNGKVTSITSYGEGDLDSDYPFPKDKSNGNNSEVRASVAYTFANGFGVQFDQVYSASRSKLFLDNDYEMSLPISKTTVNSTDTAAHLYYRTGNALIGIFAQQRSYDFGYKDNSDDISAQYLELSQNGLIKNRTLFGLEGQVFLGDLEIAAQGGFQTQGVRKLNGGGIGPIGPGGFDNIGGNLKGNFGSINANYFINDNWKVGASFGMSDYKGDVASYYYDDESEDKVTTKNKTNSWGLNSEYRFANSPLSLFAAYKATTNKLKNSYVFDSGFDYTSNIKFTEDEFQLGLKLSFGSGSLRSQATSGASLNPVRPVDNLSLGSYLNSLTYINAE